MSEATERSPRMVIARRTVFAGGLAGFGSLAIGRAFAQTGESGEGGEGGEGGEDGVADSGTSVELLTALGLIEGHLRAGAALYAADDRQMAVTHMKHPGDEIYAGLAPMLDAAAAPGFTEELDALASAVESGAVPADVAQAEAEVLVAIAAARAAAGANDAETARSIERLVRVAGDEYALGIVDGEVVNLHEYQDAWGFVQVAQEQVEMLRATQPDVAAAMLAALEPTEALFRGVVPEGRVDGEASVLHGAAARIEIAGLALQ